MHRRILTCLPFKQGILTPTAIFTTSSYEIGVRMNSILHLYAISISIIPRDENVQIVSIVINHRYDLSRYPRSSVLLFLSKRISKSLRFILFEYKILKKKKKKRQNDCSDRSAKSSLSIDQKRVLPSRLKSTRFPRETSLSEGTIIHFGLQPVAVSR